MISWLIETSILAPALASFATAVGLHIVLTRLRPQAQMTRVLGGSLVTGALICIALLWLRQAGEYREAWITDGEAILAVYCALAYIYGDLYGFNLTSLRLQALRCIRRRAGAASRDHLIKACGSEKTVDRRLAQYLRSGDLILTEGRYHMGRQRILRITQAFRIIRRIVLGAHPRGM